MLIKFNYFYSKYEYYNNDLQCHRLDGPSFENADGDKCWYKNGSFHREDGPAVTEYYSGYNDYYLNGFFYKEKEYWNIIKFKGFL